MFKILIKKIISRLKNLINRISLFFLKEKLKKFKSNPKINSVKYLNLIFEYFSSQHQNQYVALGYIRKKMKTKELKINYNLIDYLLPKKQMPLPDFFKNKINCFNVDECLGIGDFKIQQKYDETINS